MTYQQCRNREKRFRQPASSLRNRAENIVSAGLNSLLCRRRTSGKFRETGKYAIRNCSKKGGAPLQQTVSAGEKQKQSASKKQRSFGRVLKKNTHAENAGAKGDIL